METEKAGTFKTIEELLALAASIHRKLSRHCEAQKSSLAGDDAKLLLDYIRQSETHFTGVLSKYHRQAPRQVLDTVYQFTPDDSKRSAARACG